LLSSSRPTANTADAVWFSLFTALSRALLVKMGKEAMEHDYQGQPIVGTLFQKPEPRFEPLVSTG
jgi:hypothetical protein